jgi:hypothetical protein
MKKQTTSPKPPPTGNLAPNNSPRHNSRLVRPRPKPAPSHFLVRSAKPSPPFSKINPKATHLIPITAGHIAILQQLNSPFLEAIRLVAVAAFRR